MHPPTDGPAHRILNGLSAVQRDILLHPAAVRQVIAAAGSGKTRTVIALAEHAIQGQGLAPESVLFLSFSRKAVEEIRSRLSPETRARIEVSTFHAFCFRRLPEIDPTLPDGRVQVLGEAERDAFLRREMAALGPELGGTPYELLLRRPDIFRRAFPTAAMRVFRALATHKRRTGQLEYEDLIQRMLVSLARPTAAANRLRTAFRLVIVDEFQDTDPAQLRFLKLMKPERLVVVGDDWQAIYGFRGADVRPFLDFPRHFRGAARLRLAENYRSFRPIMDLGSRIIRASRRRLRKKVSAIRGSAPRPGLPVTSLAIASGGEARFVAELPPECDAIVLVRSNFRRRLWIHAGLQSERVLTIHRAKGLEFPAVFLDLIAGWSGRGGRTDDDEELRIAYVGVTRAMNLLCVLHAHEYRQGDATARVLEAARRGLKSVTAEGLAGLVAREKRLRSETGKITCQEGPGRKGR